MPSVPMIFDSASILAVAAGRITRTRRVIVGWPTKDMLPFERRPGKWGTWLEPGVRGSYYFSSPKVGDTLWTRETWGTDANGRLFYQADNPDAPVTRWRTPLFQKEKDARLLLRVDGVRVERLHAITRADVLAEGLAIPRGANHLDVFREVWKARSDTPWSVNPWVCVYIFSVSQHRNTNAA